MFNMNASDLEEEILKFQLDIPLRARASEKKNPESTPRRTIPRLEFNSPSFDSIFWINLPLRSNLLPDEDN
jgi:hypothetical protein